MRGCPAGVLSHIGDGSLRAQIAAAVAVIHAAIRIYHNGDGESLFVVDAVGAFADAASAFHTAQNVNNRVPFFAILHFSDQTRKY